ncbi:hypothetical protein L21SP2_1131 [Salinispira pacifica]|uniref:Uncharacterized protein n=1 Tax=Salinispira pacifica TaxID=1307761 RepID=V5WG70_9SPIO|nr:hypothetical protein L21SP2_1131 [Salinispira pacifica]
MILFTISTCNKTPDQLESITGILQTIRTGMNRKPDPEFE